MSNDDTALHKDEEISVADSLSPEELIRAATSSHLELETAETAKIRKESLHNNTNNNDGSIPPMPTLERLPNLRSVTPGAFHEGGNRNTSSSSSATIPDLENGSSWSQQQHLSSRIERPPSPTSADDSDSQMMMMEHHHHHKPVLVATLVEEDAATTSHGTSSDEERPVIYSAEPIGTTTTVMNGEDDDSHSQSSKFLRHCCWHPSKRITALLIVAVAISFAAVGVAISETFRVRNQHEQIDHMKDNTAADSSDDTSNTKEKIAAEEDYAKYFEPYDRITQHVAFLVFFQPKNCRRYTSPKVTFTCWRDQDNSNNENNETENTEGIMIENSTGLSSCQRIAENSLQCDFDFQLDRRELLGAELIRSRATALFTCGTFEANYVNVTDRPTAVVEISDLHGYCDDDDGNGTSTRKTRDLALYENSEADGPGTVDVVSLLGLGRLCNPTYIKYLDQVFHAIPKEGCLDSEVFSSGVILAEHPGNSLSNLSDVVTYCYNSDAHCNRTDCESSAVEEVTAMDTLLKNKENCQATSYSGIKSLIDPVSRQSDLNRILDYQDESVLGWLVDNDYHHINNTSSGPPQRLL